VDGLGAAEDGVVGVDPGGRAKGGMAGEGEFFAGGEDAGADAAGLLDGGVAREEEDGFGQVSLAGDLLHVPGRKAARVGKDGEGIAFEGALGEDIDEGVREGSGWGCG